MIGLTIEKKDPSRSLEVMPLRVRYVTIDDHIKVPDKVADSHFRQYLPHNVHIFE